MIHDKKDIKGLRRIQDRLSHNMIRILLNSVLFIHTSKKLIYVGNFCWSASVSTWDSNAFLTGFSCPCDILLEGLPSAPR
jgi:hypothetical protein